MTRCEQYASLRSRGFTYGEIAKLFGVSRQAVLSGIRHVELRKERRPRCEYIPDGLRKWLEANNMSLAQLGRATGINLYSALQTRNMGQKHINTILQATGLSYEEVFGPSK